MADGGSSFRFVRDAATWKPDSDTGVRLLDLPDGRRVFIDENERRHFFNQVGRLSSVQDLGEPPVRMERDSADNLSIVDPFGRVIRFSQTFVPGALNVRADLPGGTHIQYSYDNPNGAQALRLKAVRWADGTTRTYLYCTDPGESTANCPQGGWRFTLTGIIDEQGQRFSTYRYSWLTAPGTGDSRLISSTHALGTDQHSFLYPSTSRTVATGPLGSSTSFDFFVSNGVKFPSSIRRTCAGASCPTQSTLNKPAQAMPPDLSTRIGAAISPMTASIRATTAASA
jgi:hypothetical protein